MLARFWSDAVRGTLWCSRVEKTYFTSPEQSNAEGPAAPYRYGLPFWAAATETAVVPRVLALAWGAGDTMMRDTTAARAARRVRTAVRRPGMVVRSRVVMGVSLPTACEVSCRVRAEGARPRTARLHPEAGENRPKWVPRSCPIVNPRAATGGQDSAAVARTGRCRPVHPECPPVRADARRRSQRPASIRADQESRRAASPAVTTKLRGSVQPRSAKASRMPRRAASTPSTCTRAMLEPPKPPPVIRAPRAPVARAASTETSSSAQLTS